MFGFAVVGYALGGCLWLASVGGFGVAGGWWVCCSRCVLLWGVRALFGFVVVLAATACFRFCCLFGLFILVGYVVWMLAISIDLVVGCCFLVCGGFVALLLVLRLLLV